MADITMCRGDGCPVRENCYRFKAEPSQYRQSYFKSMPIDANGHCEVYIPIYQPEQPAAPTVKNTEMPERVWWVKQHDGTIAVVGDSEIDSVTTEYGRQSPPSGSVHSALQDALNYSDFLMRFWIEKVEMALDPEDSQSVVRVAGEHYLIGDEGDKVCRGHGGRRFKIKFTDGRQVTTTNLWYQGRIPKAFQGLLPDNAEFVNDE